MSRTMFKGTRWLAASILTFACAATTWAGQECSTLKGCEAKQCEIDALIEQARKDGNMRRLSTLKDLRNEHARCGKPDAVS